MVLCTVSTRGVIRVISYQMAPLGRSKDYQCALKAEETLMLYVLLLFSAETWRVIRGRGGRGGQ